jgi:hypothetical protein
MRDILVSKDAKIRVTESVAKRFIELLAQEDEREIRVYGSIEVVPDGESTDTE